MKAQKVAAFVFALLLLASACSPKIVESPPTAPKEQAAPKSAERVVKETVVVEQDKGVGRSAQPAATPAPAEAPKSTGSGGMGEQQPSPYQAGRMIIKNGQMGLVVEDTDRAVDDVTRIAVERGGYLIGLETAMHEDYKTASVTVGVPVDEFENVQRAVRSIALRVVKDSATGVDVSDQYVDTQSRLTNLEATQARIRKFLDQATTVEESLRVNAQLAEIEAQIEQVKGRLNYLKDRAAYSTLTVDIEPERPTPTPTATATPTPTPTPNTWRPGETFHAAGSALGSILRFGGDLAIWVGVVIVPLLAPLVAIIALASWLGRRRARRRATAPAPPASQAPPPQG